MIVAPVVAIVFAVIATPASDGMADFELFMRHCHALPDSAKKISSCLSILDRVGPQQKYATYSAISMTYFAMKNLDRAIEYQEMAVRTYPANPANVGDKAYARRAHYLGRSYSHNKLGMLQALKAMSLYVDDRSYAAGRVYASAARASFSRAISANPTNHEAYAQRGELNSRLCRPSDARSDISMAIDLAKRINNADAVKKYRDIRDDNCWKEWKDIP